MPIQPGERRHDVGPGRAGGRPEGGGACRTDVGELREGREHRARVGGRRRRGRLGGRGIRRRGEVLRPQVRVERRGCQERGHTGLDLGGEVGVAELECEARVGKRQQALEPQTRVVGGGGAEHADRRRDRGVDGEDRRGARDGVELRGQGAERAGELGQLGRREKALVERTGDDRDDDADGCRCADRRRHGHDARDGEGTGIGLVHRAERVDAGAPGRQLGGDRVDRDRGGLGAERGHGLDAGRAEGVECDAGHVAGEPVAEPAAGVEGVATDLDPHIGGGHGRRRGVGDADRHGEGLVGLDQTAGRRGDRDSHTARGVARRGGRGLGSGRRERRQRERRHGRAGGEPRRDASPTRGARARRGGRQGHGGAGLLCDPMTARSAAILGRGP